MPDTEEQSSEKVAHLSIKPPNFSTATVAAWFKVMESQFKVARMTSSSTKFHHVFGALPMEVVLIIPDEITSAESYERIKTFLTEKFERTKPEVFEELLRTTTLTGKPSFKLDQLRDLAKRAGVQDDFVRHKFLSILPVQIRTVLMTQEELNLTALGKLADQIAAALAPIQQIAQIGQASSGGVPSNLFKGVTPFKPGQRPHVCRYHLYYHANSKKCTNWCKWPNKNGCEILAPTRPGSRAASRDNTPRNSRPSSPQRSGN